MFALATASQAMTAFAAIRSGQLNGMKRVRAWAIVLVTIVVTLLVVIVGLTALRL
jgi:t-SNARE complex subunit (syntaxin)